MVFTEEDLICWGRHSDAHLVSILNGEYNLQDAKEDLESLVGSKFDPRNKNYKER
jgi:hypothetical protein